MSRREKLVYINVTLTHHRLNSTLLTQQRSDEVEVPTEDTKGEIWRSSTELQVGYICIGILTIVSLIMYYHSLGLQMRFKSQFVCFFKWDNRQCPYSSQTKVIPLQIWSEHNEITAYPPTKSFESLCFEMQKADLFHPHVMWKQVCWHRNVS